MMDSMGATEEYAVNQFKKINESLKSELESMLKDVNEAIDNEYKLEAFIQNPMQKDLFMKLLPTLDKLKENLAQSQIILVLYSVLTKKDLD